MDGLSLAGVLDVLSAGGDVAMMALLYIMWRFDRRLLRLEFWLNNQRRETDVERG